MEKTSPKKALNECLYSNEDIGHFISTSIDLLNNEEYLKFSIYMKVYHFLYIAEFNDQNVDSFLKLLNADKYTTLLLKHYDDVNEKHGELLDIMMFDYKKGNCKKNIVNNESLAEFIGYGSISFKRVF